MTRIATTHYRYKRPSRKRKPVALEVPVIVTKASKHDVAPKQEPVSAPPANDDRKSAIVTIRRKGRATAPDLTPEELQRRADAADALWRELVRRATSMNRP